MKFKKLFIVAASVLMACSCSTQRNISYFSDMKPGETELALPQPSEIRIRPKDELSILVNSQNPKLTNLFNLPVVSQQIGMETPSASSHGIAGYTVDSKGDIDFPVLGEIHVAGMTREEVEDHIKKELQSHDLIKDPVVTVKFMNLGFSVMGEVNSPGQYRINKDKLSILEALSMAGDLTIYGRRENVLVMRSEEGKQHVYAINLSSGEQVYSSPVYYLQQDDVVYVEPNETKARQSTVNGNNVRSTSFWISIASLLTSVVTTIAVFINK